MSTGLIFALICALAALVYGIVSVSWIMKKSTGNDRMREIAAAIQAGAQAYLNRQYTTIAIVGVLLFVIIWWALGGATAGGFVVGAVLSGLAGYIGMNISVRSNVRTAEAARTGLNEALAVAFRGGAITGMLVVGLGLLGVAGFFWFLLGSAHGAPNLMKEGLHHAIQPLVGLAFGSSLTSVFVRLGGGIFTKGADVGADLVGKVEAGIPEDDPRNPAFIADNVGDNVGDCAGMAADIFESYEVTIVAAMILGMATFGHKGVIFPLLVRGIGVLGSIISTYTVKAGPNDTSDTALTSVHRGFWIGSLISIGGFFALGFAYLRFDAAYLAANPMAAAGFPGGDPNALSPLLNWGFPGLDLRPAMTCLIGVFLAIALNKVTSYYTHTGHAPVKGLARACQTGHATNIIQGFAVGYESTVAAIVVIAGAIGLAVLCYAGTPPLFIAYGVAMAGIGMLTLTGNTISMDVFGPVADNANGIGEMAYDVKEMDAKFPGSAECARQILADLDAVGNTTKAETKGIAIGSAVIAAVSLFSSFIAVIAVGSEEKIHLMTTPMYLAEAGKLTVADPKVFIGFLLGGAVPFLFSSMLIRAVGRAAFYIVNECRVQFRDAAIWAGTKKPDYGRVVDICTKTAQKELIGPGFLALMAPLLVGFLLGPYALGGFLAGMILVGQLLAVFMANAGGAWDNAKKLIEDGIYGGKGSEAHKAAVTGDTVGDPLKDTAGPAINPLIKVMNMVSLLALGLVLQYNLLDPASKSRVIGIVASIIALAAIVWAVWQSKREDEGTEGMEK